MFFFMFKLLQLLVCVITLLRTGMHAEQVLDEGISPWSGSAIGEIYGRLYADIAPLLHLFN